MKYFDGHVHYKEPKEFINECKENNVVGGVLLMPSTTTKEELLKLKELCDITNSYNLDFYFLTGSFEYPTTCLTNSIEEDILTFDRCIGVKTALNSKNLKRKNNPDYKQLKDIVNQIKVAQSKTNKKLQIHIHLETDKIINNESGNNLDWIDKLVEECGVSYDLFKLTHAQKYGEEIIKYAKKGCYIDYTSSYYENDLRYNALINYLKIKDSSIKNISISSDSFGLISKGLFGNFNSLSNTYNFLIQNGVSIEILKQIFYYNPRNNIKV